MRRGELIAQPAPVVHVDWRVLFIPPEHGWVWRGWLWVLGVKLGSVWLLGMLLRSKRFADNWLQKGDPEVVLDLVVVASEAVRVAVDRAVRRDRLWIHSVHGYRTWHTYSQEARTNTHLLRLIVPDGAALPLLQGISVESYRGFAHEI